MAKRMTEFDWREGERAIRVAMIRRPQKALDEHLYTEGRYLVSD